MDAMAPKHKEGNEMLAVSGKWISWAHTISAYAAFLGALVIGIHLHYYKIVENEHYVSLPSFVARWEKLTFDPGLS